MKRARKNGLLFLAVAILTASPAWATVPASELPVSSGPYSTQPTPLGTRVLMQSGTSFAHTPVNPKATVDQLSQLVIDAQGSAPWTTLGPALRAALSNQERSYLAEVRDLRGATHVLRITAMAWPSEALFFPVKASAVPMSNDLNIVEVDRDLKHGTELHYQGATLTGAALVAALDRVITYHGALFVLPGTRPTRATFPVWLAPVGYATWQDVINAASTLEAVGFATVLLQIP